MMTKKDRVIKGQWSQEAQITSWGGLGLVERLACSTRLWSDCREFLPERVKTDGGYSSLSVAASIIHGLLSGGQGTFAAEGLRGDEALQRLLGLEAGVAEEATVWRALGQWALCGGEDKSGRIQRRQTVRLVRRTERTSMLIEGFMPSFGDGTWLEVESNSAFEGMKTFDGTSKLMLSALWVGPYLAAQSFVREGQGEESATLGLIAPVWKEVIKPLKLAASILFLMDSLYGDEPSLKQLEASEGAHYVVGANKLSGVERVASEQPESSWQKTGANTRRGWIASGLCIHTYQAEDWPAKRTVVTRRFKRVGELFWSYRSVFTNLSADHPNVGAMMRRDKISFGCAIWRLYDHKQAMENQFKDALIDMGLHHPPCRKLGRNAMFYAMGALALNLAIGVRRIGLKGKERSMRLWRLRRQLLAIPAQVRLHARQATASLYAGTQRVWELWNGALNRVGAT